MKKKENNGHGGQRKGAGRKGRFGNCSFKTMRIPDFMCPHVSAMLDMAAEWNNQCLPMSDRRSLPASQASERQRASAMKFLKGMVAFEEERLQQRNLTDQDRRQLELFGSDEGSDPVSRSDTRLRRPRPSKLQNAVSASSRMVSALSSACDSSSSSHKAGVEVTSEVKDRSADAQPQCHFINTNASLVDYAHCIDGLGCIYWRRATQDMRVGETVYFFLRESCWNTTLYEMQVADYAGERQDTLYHKRLFLTEGSVFRFDLRKRSHIQGLDIAALEDHGISRHVVYKILDSAQVAWLKSLFKDGNP